MRHSHLVITIFITICIGWVSFSTRADDVIVSTCDFASFASAIDTANAGGGTITFSCSGIIYFPYGLIITGDVTIIGEENITFDGQNRYKFFEIAPTASLTLDGLIIQNGYSGSADSTIRNNGTFIIINSIFSEVGIYSSNTITVRDSTFTNSVILLSNAELLATITDSTFNEWGITNYGGMVTISGSIFNRSGILNRDRMLITDSTIADGTQPFWGVVNNDGILDIHRTIFSNNMVTNDGGAIYNEGIITISDSTFLDNRGAYGEAIYNKHIISSQNTHYENNGCIGKTIIDNGGNTTQNAQGCPSGEQVISDLGELVVRDCGNLMGAGTFGEAVDSINNAGKGIISFACSGTIIFDRSLFIFADVIINGDEKIIFDGAQKTRLFTINDGASVTLNKLTLQKAYPNQQPIESGGAILNFGTLIIQNSIFADNQIDEMGGAIYNYGILDITNSLFTDNYGSIGGAIYNRGTVTISYSNFTLNGGDTDGAILNGGTMTISYSNFIGNRGRMGGAIYNSGGTLTVTDTIFRENIGDRSANSYEGRGGAIYNSGYSTLMIINSTFWDNIADSDGGAIYGGEDSTVTIITSTFADNLVEYYGDGGAIFSEGTVSSQDTQYDNNSCAGDAITNMGGNIANNAEGCPNSTS